MTSRIRISPEDLTTLIQAAAELADLYDLDLVPWADKAPTEGRLINGYGDRAWRTATFERHHIKNEKGEDVGTSEWTHFPLKGHPRSLGERVKSIRSLHKTYTDRLDAMRQKRPRKKCIYCHGLNGKHHMDCLELK